MKCNRLALFLRLFLLLFLATIAGVIWHVVPVSPQATVSVGQECDIIRFSPDGNTLLATHRGGFKSKGPIHVWDVSRGTERFALAEDWTKIETIHFSPDSRVLAAHEESGDLKLWNVETGQELASFMPETKFGNWVNFCFSPDGQFLAIQDYAKGGLDKDFITFLSIDGFHEHGSIESYFHTITFAPDGQTIATFTRKNHGKTDRVLLWRMGEEGSPALIKEHHISADYIAFSPSLATFASATSGSKGAAQIEMWDMATGKRLTSCVCELGDCHFQSLKFVDNGKSIVTHGGGGTQLSWRTQTIVWDMVTAPWTIGSFAVNHQQSLLDWVAVPFEEGSFGTVEPVLSLDGNWVAVPQGKGASLFMTARMAECKQLRNVNDESLFFSSYNGHVLCHSITFSPDSKTLAVEGLHYQERESALAKYLPRQLNPFPGDSSGAVVRLWDTETCKELMAFKGCNKAVFSPNNKWVATLNGENIDIWSLPIRKPMWTIVGLTAGAWLFVLVLLRLSIALSRMRS